MTKGRTKNAIMNMGMSFFNQISSLLLSFISRTIFIKVLGIELLGVNGLFTDILGLLSMADLGFNTAMVYSFYKPIAENNTEKIAALVNFYRRIYRIIAISIASIGLALTPFINVIVNTPKPISQLRIYYLFALAGVVVSYLFVYRTSIITADQKNYIIVKITMIITFIKTFLQIIVLLLFKSYILYLFINVIGNFTINYIGSRQAIKLYPYINQKNELAKDERKKIFKNIKSMFLYKLSSLILNATDNTLISLIIGTVTVGLYSNYLLITNKTLSIIQLVFGAITASIGNLVISENHDKRYEIFKATQSISFIICGIVVTSFWLLVNDFIKIWLGEKYMFDSLVVCAITVNMYLACVLQPLWTYREATGLYVKTKYIMIVAAIINLILSVILGNLIGISGILFASAIARLTTYFWFEPLLLFKEYFNTSVKYFYYPIILNICAVLFISLILTMIFNNFFIVNSWSSLIIKAGICGIVTTIIFILIYFKSEGFEIILKKAKLK